MPAVDGDTVQIVEVGPRDGLQNEPGVIPKVTKVGFIENLVRAGVRSIECTSFVDPARVPQLSDAAEVMTALRRATGVRYSALVPNLRGYERSREAGVDSIAIFAAATEAFSQANIRCSIDESFARFDPIMSRAKQDRVWVRGYVSVAFDCPYSGVVAAADVINVARRLFEIGCDEVSIADTIGSATIEAVGRLLEPLLRALPSRKLAFHFHDTHGRAVHNAQIAFDAGIRIFDGAAGGLGGCPFAPGAAGNVATERLVEHFHARHVSTGIDGPAITAAVDRLRARGA